MYGTREFISYTNEGSPLGRGWELKYLALPSQGGAVFQRQEMVHGPPADILVTVRIWGTPLTRVERKSRTTEAV